MTIKLTKMEALTFLLIGAALVLFGSIEAYLINATIATFIFILITKTVEKNSLIHMMFFLGFAIFIYAPALINGYYLDTSFELYYLTSFAALFFITRTKELGPPQGNPKKYRFLFFIASFGVAAGSFYEGLSLFFLGPMIAFFPASLNPHRRTDSFLTAVIFFGAFTVYVIYGWSGFGRAVTAGYAITGLLAFCITAKININKFMFGAAGFLGTLLLVSRKDGFSELSIARSIDDSAIGPYRLASTFIDTMETRGFDFPGLLDQLVFSAFSFVPREIWPTKPFGFGFQYVVENMDSYLAEAGHSIASTLIADHFYYIGWLGFASSLLILFIITVMIKIFYREKLFDGHVTSIFAANMLVLVWGGMTSFSARMIYPLLGMLPFAVLTYIFQKRRVKISPSISNFS